jgi:CheY-like chemotaxis protein
LNSGRAARPGGEVKPRLAPVDSPTGGTPSRPDCYASDRQHNHARAADRRGQPADLELTKHALDQTGLPLIVLAARDGEEAMTLLRTVRPPDLILLDLNLPRKNGLEVLAKLAGDPELRRIPVVVLSSSTAQTDVRAAYDRNERLSGQVGGPGRVHRRRAGPRAGSG